MSSKYEREDAKVMPCLDCGGKFEFHHFDNDMGPFWHCNNCGNSLECCEVAAHNKAALAIEIVDNLIKASDSCGQDNYTSIVDRNCERIKEYMSVAEYIKAGEYLSTLDC